jgi:hypothetical protein
MKSNEIFLSSIPIDQLAKLVSEILLTDLKNNSTSTVIKRTEYLTRKEAYLRLGITGPTFDKLILRAKIDKLGTGKSARFRKEDVEHIFENLNKLLYK